MNVTLSLSKLDERVPLLLNDSPDLPSVRETVLETDELSLLLQTPTPTSPTLWLQDVPLDDPKVRSVEGGLVYTWGRDRLFLNHFGICELRLALPEVTTKTFAYVEVYARKINAERAEDMLTFLEARMDDVVRSCFSRTSLPAIATESSKRTEHASVLLKAAGTALSFLEEVVPRLAARPRSRLRNVPEVRPYESARSLGAEAVAWVAQNPDTLVPTRAGGANVWVSRRPYTLREVAADVLTNDTDVYENRITHGFLADIRAVLWNITSIYQRILNTVVIQAGNQIPDDYQSFEQLREHYGKRYIADLLGTCSTYLYRADALSLSLNQLVPVSRSIREAPQFTPGFSSSPLYHELFQQIHTWYALGPLDRSADVFLFGLKNLAKLYEFYCLYRLVDTLKQSGLRLAKTFTSRDVPEMDVYPVDTFLFTGFRVAELRYTPRIRVGGVDLVDVHHRKTAVYSYWEPDFLLKIDNSYAVLDAKYRPFVNTRKDFSGLALKYLHGLGNNEGGISPVIALFALYPRQEDEQVSWSYQAEEYSLFGDRPAVPNLGILGLTPGEENSKEGVLFRRFVQELLNFLQRGARQPETQRRNEAARGLGPLSSQ